MYAQKRHNTKYTLNRRNSNKLRLIRQPNTHTNTHRTMLWFQRCQKYIYPKLVGTISILCCSLIRSSLRIGFYDKNRESSQRIMISYRYIYINTYRYTFVCRTREDLMMVRARVGPVQIRIN